MTGPREPSPGHDEQDEQDEQDQQDQHDQHDLDRDMTGQDPLSSTAEGDDDPGTAALAVPGAQEETDGRPDADGPSFAEAGPPPEAADPTPLTDASPETHMGDPAT